MNKTDILTKLKKTFSRITNNVVCNFTKEYPEADVNYTLEESVPEFEQKATLCKFIDETFDEKYKDNQNCEMISPSPNYIVIDLEDNYINSVIEVGPVNYSLWRNSDLYRYGLIKENTDNITGTFYCLSTKKIVDPENENKYIYKQLVDVTIEYIDYIDKPETTINIKFYTKQNDRNEIEYLRYLFRLSYYLADYKEGVSKTNCTNWLYAIKTIRDLYDYDTVFNSIRYNDILKYKNSVDKITITDNDLIEVEEIFKLNWLKANNLFNKKNFAETESITDNDFHLFYNYYTVKYDTLLIYENQKLTINHINKLTENFNNELINKVYDTKFDYTPITFLSKKDITELDANNDYIYKLTSKDIVLNERAIDVEYDCGNLPE